MPLRVIDLFAGCGGLTAGFASTGQFRSVAAVELDREAAATYALNFGDHLHVGDISDWDEAAMPQADIVVGGPPCQGFSALGLQDPEDPRSQLWNQYLRVLRQVDPDYFVLENVPQFLHSQQFRDLLEEASPRGPLASWRLEAHLLNASDHGTAQARRRAIIIGRRAGTPELGKPDRNAFSLTVRDLLGALPPRVTTVDLPDSWHDFRGTPLRGVFKMADLHVTRRPTERSQARFRAIPPGGNRFDLPDELSSPGWRRHTSGSADVMGRLRWEKPSVTIRTEFYKPEKGRYLHPEQHRPITHYEAALLQGFPEDFLWCGRKQSIARQIGNAVPVPLAKAVAEHLLRRIGA